MGMNKKEAQFVNVGSWTMAGQLIREQHIFPLQKELNNNNRRYKIRPSFQGGWSQRELGGFADHGYNSHPIGTHKSKKRPDSMDK